MYIERYSTVSLKDLQKQTNDPDIQPKMLLKLRVEYEKVADVRLPACSRMSGRLLETCCTILDLDGVGYKAMMAVTEVAKSATKISQDCYPERLGKLFVINAPWYFKYLYAAVKTFLDPVTVAKIEVLGSDYQKTLLAQIPAENLPWYLGGTCTCGGNKVEEQQLDKLKTRWGASWFNSGLKDSENCCMHSDAGPWQEERHLKPMEPLGGVWKAQADGALDEPERAGETTSQDTRDGHVPMGEQKDEVKDEMKNLKSEKDLEESKTVEQSTSRVGQDELAQTGDSDVADGVKSLKLDNEADKNAV